MVDLRQLPGLGQSKLFGHLVRRGPGLIAFLFEQRNLTGARSLLVLQLLHAFLEIRLDRFSADQTVEATALSSPLPLWPIQNDQPLAFKAGGTHLFNRPSFAPPLATSATL